MGGCGCGCDEPEKQDNDLGRLEADAAFEESIASIQAAMAQAWALGFREGARAVTDISEAQAQPVAEDELSNLVEADAVALDSALSRLQDITLRLEALELAVGLKYVG